MGNGLRDALSLAGIVAILVAGVWLLKPESHSQEAPQETRITYDTIVDTITYYHPVPKDSAVVRYVYVKLPAKGDSIKHDSIYVEVPIEQKEYRDSTYTAWVSGYKASLDSIQLYPRTVVQSITVTESKQRCFGVGVIGGVGWDGQSAAPYIGIGVSYNLWTW